MELFTRKMGALPISIGTSMALESIFIRPNPEYDPSRKVPQIIKLSNYTELWINIETLIRNIAQSVERTVYLDCTAEHIFEILLSEIDIINSIMLTEGYDICKPIYYHCSYRSLSNQRHGRVELRQSNTVIQKSYDLKSELVIKLLEKKTDSIFKFDSELKKDHKHTILMLTHYPFDLTSYSNFRKMDLLESHTGILKTRDQWNSKYAPFGQLSLSHLPFFRELLLIFGDKTMISPQDRKIRQKVYDISIADKWTPYTIIDKVHAGYRTHITHPADLQVIKSFQ